MKTFKKLFSVVLTLILTFAVMNNVSAASNGTITVNGTTNGKTYAIYKIFDLTLNGEGENAKVAYTIDSDWVEFFNGVGAKYIVGTNNTAGTLNQIIIDNTTRKYIDITESNIAEFTQAALAYVGTKTPDKQEVATGSTLQFTTLELGYYLVFPKGATDVSEKWSTICSITSTVPTATVEVKATYPTIDKVVDDYSVEVGQVVEFTITGRIPDTTGFTTYTYEVKDTMSEGLLFNDEIDNLRVYFGEDKAETTEVDERHLVPSTEYTLEIKDNGFTLTFNMVNQQTYKNQKITIFYNAKVTEAAIDSATTKNSATLTYSNDPQNNNKTTTTPVERYLYSADIDVIKVDGNNQQTKLAGATFVLKNAEGKYYKAIMNGETLVDIEWVNTLEEATSYTTGEEGTIKFAGLEDGTYHLVETAAPEGFNLLVEEIVVTVQNNGREINAVPTINQVTETVLNYSGTQLPTTGGMGTKLFILIGSLIALASAVILITNKRMAKEY